MVISLAHELFMNNWILVPKFSHGVLVRVVELFHNMIMDNGTRARWST